MFISSCILTAFIVNVINGEHVNIIDSFLNLFDGKSIKLCIGFPSIKINGMLSFKYGFSYITYTEYNPKYSRSVKIESDFFSKPIDNETYIVQLVSDKIYMEKSHQEVSRLKIVSIPFNDVFPINQNSISLSLNYIDNSYSLVHDLYNQELIS